MDKTISIIRISILFTLSSFAILLIGGEETDEGLFQWLLHFVIDKSLGIAACLFLARLYKRWGKTDHWISAFDKLIGDVMDEPEKTGQDNLEK